MTFPPPDDINITPEMVDAGLDALIAHRSDENDSYMVEAIYLAMLRRSLANPCSGYTIAPEQVRLFERLSWTEDHVRELKRLIAVGRAQISELRALKRNLAP
jgi:hypothetical protein